MHRLIVRCPATCKVHHINHDTLDNRRQNLMIVTEYEHRHFDGWHIFKRTTQAASDELARPPILVGLR